jgi:hypothetical protein
MNRFREIASLQFFRTRTHEIGFDLGSGFAGQRPTVTFFLQVTDVFQLKILWAEVQLRFVRAS